MSEDGEYTILKRKYIERGCRIAELEDERDELCAALSEQTNRAQLAVATAKGLIDLIDGLTVPLQEILQEIRNE